MQTSAKNRNFEKVKNREKTFKNSKCSKNHKVSKNFQKILQKKIIKKCTYLDCV